MWGIRATRSVTVRIQTPPHLKASLTSHVDVGVRTGLTVATKALTHSSGSGSRAEAGVAVHMKSAETGFADGGEGKVL